MKFGHSLALLFAILPFGAVAHDYKVGDLSVAHPIAAETPQSATATVGAAYLTITNNGDAEDRLVGVSAAFPRVTIHKTTVQNEIATMQSQDSVAIPPGETVTFEPGGLHVMFMGLNGDPFTIGEEISATLTFEKAGEIDIIFVVEAIDHNH